MMMKVTNGLVTAARDITLSSMTCSLSALHLKIPDNVLRHGLTSALKGASPDLLTMQPARELLHSRR